jgi:D-glycero-D-manno-heptose 1,7-bisphosphate phosphatase
VQHAPAHAPACSPIGRPIEWVFLDRDGTINVKPRAGEYVERPEEVALLPGAAEAIALLNRAGLWTAVITNQRGVALGRMSLADLDGVHRRLRELLALRGARLDAIYACPHEVGACDCRKPSAGMLLQAKRDQPALDFARAAVVGDSDNDIEAGAHVGAATLLIRAGADERYAKPVRADRVADDLLQAARMLIAPTPRA